MVRQGRKKVRLTTKFLSIYGRTLGSPCGRAGTALCAVTERGEKRHARKNRLSPKRKAPVSGRCARLHFLPKRIFRRSAPLWGRGSSGGAPHRPGSCPG